MKNISKTENILKKVEKLPYFSINDLAGLGDEKKYLKIFLNRLNKKDKIVCLKKGLYVSKKYISQTQKKGLYNDYLEFIANIIYTPSYLSLEYILLQNNILTENTHNITLISRNKTAKFENGLDLFVYHSVKDSLFTGYKIIKQGDYSIYKATLAKALFDYLYLRKNILNKEKAIKELRLNLDNLGKKDLAELKRYIKLEGSKRMNNIFEQVLNLKK